MRNRMDVVWQGRRTTARFPSYLWRLAMIATQKDDSALVDLVRATLDDCPESQKAPAPARMVCAILADLIEEELTLARFNPAPFR